MMTKGDVVLIEVDVTMLDADAREIVFSGTLTHLKTLNWEIQSQWSSAQL